MTVSASSDGVLSEAANMTRRVIELRRGGSALGGSYLYQGDALITGWHSHEVHQIEYALHGVVEVENDSAHYLLPPQQAAWIPAGLDHQAVMNPEVKTVAVMFDRTMIADGGDRARILAVSPLIREMMIYALRWPIDRSRGAARDEEMSDGFFRTLAALVGEALEHEAPLSLPTSEHPNSRRRDGIHQKPPRRGDLCTGQPGGLGLGANTSPVVLRHPRHAWRTYLLHARMLRAMALLAAPMQSVQETATAVGFDSVSSFIRAFAQFCGETPSAYHKRVTGTQADSVGTGPAEQTFAEQ